MDIYSKVKERFIKYVKVETTSMYNGKNTPTTKCQFDLAHMLYNELIDLGFSDVFIDEDKCIVYGKVLGNIDGIPFGLIAHMDTSPDVSGKNVNPWVYENYDGKDVILNKEKNIVMKTSEFDNLLKYIGNDIVFTDGNTLLGGDDKAAIAEIITMGEFFLLNKDIPHPTICLAFTPDEEVGGLAKDLDFKRLGAKIAYTVDGDHVGYYSDETFNATEAMLEIKGKNVHPGTAYNIMVDAVEIASEFVNMLPKDERPWNTMLRQGFYHPHYINGTVEYANCNVLIRDHDIDLFNNRINYVISCVDKLNLKYNNAITLKFGNNYLSMKSVVDKVPYMIDDLVHAIKNCNVIPVHLAFRGGTDGSSISQRGLPCPNISAGYENGHSRYEYVPINSMVTITNILIELAKKLAKRRSE